MINFVEKTYNNDFLGKLIRSCNKSKCNKVVYENKQYLNTQVLPCKYLHENETIENYQIRIKTKKVLFKY